MLRKIIIMVTACCALLFGCGDGEDVLIQEESSKADKVYHVSKISGSEEAEIVMSENVSAYQSLNGIWVSQFDMHYIYRDGGEQREETDYREKVQTMISNLKRDGFNTVFLQVRPNGDSMYESEIYPMSRYIAGSYGVSISYDAIAVFLEIAKESGISVHAWINPFRLCYQDELEDLKSGILYEWYKEGIGERIEISESGILYLDPSYEEASELIASGAREILEKYDFDGIHIDDYFYPTEFEIDDDNEFKESGYGDKGEFRRANIDRTVKLLYETVHSFEGKVFGISPAGNIYSLGVKWYVDIYKWLEEDGYTDYIMPQLYFGFQNAVCPFETILKDWTEAVKNDEIELYIGLSAAKCALGSEGKEDYYAGDNGKYEWRDNKDILKRSYEMIAENETADGFCIFTYSSFYDPLTGDDNPLTYEEKAAFCEAVG